MCNTIHLSNLCIIRLTLPSIFPQCLSIPFQILHMPWLTMMLWLTNSGLTFLHVYIWFTRSHFYIQLPIWPEIWMKTYRLMLQGPAWSNAMNRCCFGTNVKSERISASREESRENLSLSLSWWGGVINGPVMSQWVSFLFPSLLRFFLCLFLSAQAHTEECNSTPGVVSYPVIDS